MNSPISPRSPKRQLTLGPATPIQDWEVERATLLKNYKESQEKAERLEKLLQEEQTTFEKNTSSLLREVKLKENYLEKKLKDVEQSLMDQILDLQQKLVDEKTEHQEQIESLKAKHEQALEIEDKKYQRRLLGLQQRLNAKDKDYAELLEKMNPDEEKDELILSLKLKLAKAEEEVSRVTTNQAPVHQDKASIPEEVVEDLEVRYQSAQERLSTAESTLLKYQEREKEYIDRISELEKRAQQYKKRLDQAQTGHDAQIHELAEKFMSEAKQSEMTHQARIQNLQSEHADILRELRDRHQTEKEVWSIENQAAIDELRRVLILEKKEEVEKVSKEWREKYEDLHASMSKDSMEFQSHWEMKLEEMKNQYSAKIARLLGEIEVIKDRLGKEIERRKQNEHTLFYYLELNDKLQDRLNTCQTHLKQHMSIEREIYQLKQMQKSSSKLAKNALSVISPDISLDSNVCLQDMLQMILSHTLIMRNRTCQDYCSTFY
ncbi:hypothetical protein G6F57_000907 [Rhizopus arrhizus]|uniref:Uncharacterized protein n=1 Tax=Rhizopus oryzae TaxID=64495 RepID=A0A9P6XG11_RHIOR|nr:hypothetical protein G6F23_006936 [Rhizopus arrhizus]KAG0755418.1 hypothetical protein G6F24_011847 [Rhizopus arrhizus]KAG0796410.1 hypothetical protein G6F21_001331 [Rhizopus arrhizus]KAG0813313.1 hypothetical protein G6F20_005658 [Rhizopus arrhizus]KAG0833781.1 hypothetical protein G6F18_006625 [Rhizopus arrhizus]